MAIFVLGARVVTAQADVPFHFVLGACKRGLFTLQLVTILQ